jgi:hypothetical protein
MPEQFHQDAERIIAVAHEAIDRIDELTETFTRDRVWNRVVAALFLLGLVYVGPIDAHFDCVRANDARAAIRTGIRTALHESYGPERRKEAARVASEVFVDIPDRDCSWLVVA